jgi:hypothetical protein
MSTTEDDEPEEKKYCCGNSAQNEAGYVSKCDCVSGTYIITFDLVMISANYFLQALVVNGLVFYVLVTVLLFVGEGEDNVLRSYVNNNPALSDLNILISAESKYIKKIDLLIFFIIFLFLNFFIQCCLN